MRLSIEWAPALRGSSGKRGIVHAQQTVTTTHRNRGFAYSFAWEPFGLARPLPGEERRNRTTTPFKRKKYVNAQESEKIAEAFRKANKAFEKEDYKAGAESLKTAYFINPEDDLIINFLAESYAMVGDRSAFTHVAAKTSNG